MIHGPRIAKAGALAPGRPIMVECVDCHRSQLRWSNDYPQGLLLVDLEKVGWHWDGTVWRCPVCFEATL